MTLLKNPYVKALRPHQWLKNLLIFVPIVTAHRFGIGYLWNSALAFVAFSLLASSVYVVNDLLDIESDRAHPRKRSRPFASGALTTRQGVWIAFGLLAVSLSIAFNIGGMFAAVLLFYFLTSTAYSAYLKRKLVIDICVLAGLYTIRIVAGGVATGVPLSVWLLAFSIFFFLSLAAVKRQAELVDGVSSGEVKAQGRGYHVDDLPIISNMALSAGYVAVLIMALYINSPEVAPLYNRPYAIWGVCLVLLFWISRMVMVTHRGAMHDDPIIYALKDRVSYYCLAFIAAFLIVGVLS
jgi:4-hydroxybenzoate polyprenyltransferase